MHHRSIFLLSLLAWSLTSLAATKTYTADNTTVFCNPERGFYHHTEQTVTATGETNLSKSTFTKAREQGHTLLLRLYYLNNFRSKELPQAVLNQIDNDFGLFRQYGCKAVLRFAYTNDNDNYPIKDATPAIWKRHLEQLKPVLHANADVIAVVQAGFMGAWGEWYFSSQGTGNEISQQVKNDLINQLLDAVPVSRAVQLRTPEYKRSYLGKDNDAALTQGEAFSGTVRARLGHHNDAFLYKDDNMGTYENRTADMTYLGQECLYVPNGGETDVYKEDVYQGWATGDKAQAEMAQLHYSYLNQGYAELTLNHWRKDGSFDILDAHMGYRFQLEEATIPEAITAPDSLSVSLRIRNAGYASPYNERHAYVVLYNDQKTYALSLASDPRLWAPNGELTSINEKLALPKGIRSGKYDVALWLPDVGYLIQDDPRFAIRFANKDVWDETTGYNELGLQLTVTSTDPEPEPEPESTVDPVTEFSAKAGQLEAYLTWKNPAVSASDSSSVRVDISKGVKYASSKGNATIAYADGVSTVSFSTSDNWHAAGVDYAVSEQQQMLSVSFEYKGDGLEVTLIPYVYDGTYRWYGRDQLLSTNSTEWQTCTLVPDSTLWATPTYKFLDQPVTGVGFVANPSKSASGSFAIRNVVINREKKQQSRFSSVRIIRKEGVAPSGYNDGETAYTGSDTEYTDTNLPANKTYYYAAYAVYEDGTIALPATCSVTIENTGLNTDPIPASKLSTKIFCGGQLLIIHNGTIYNVLGEINTME